MFDKLDPSLLINTQIANCLKVYTGTVFTQNHFIDIPLIMERVQNQYFPHGALKLETT